MTDRLIELDILRAFAVIGVILIHISSGALYTLDSASLNFKIYLAIDQFFRFSVPLFVAISGYVLTLKYAKTNFKFTDFFKKRVLRLLPWYFFWSAVILAYLRFTHWWIQAPRFPVWKIIFLGKADYHLYFVPMIFQLYLSFPLLLILYKKFGYKLLAATFLLETAFYYTLTFYESGKIDLPVLLNDQQQYLFSGTWVFYFILGMVLTDMSKIPDKIQEKLRFFSVFTFLIGFIWMFSNSLSILKSQNLVVATRSTRIAVLVYATGFILTSILYREKLLNIPKKITQILYKIGGRSYVIYLLHTLMIRIFTDYIQVATNVNFIAVSTLTIISSDYLAQITTSISRKVNTKIFIQKMGAIKNRLKD